MSNVYGWCFMRPQVEPPDGRDHFDAVTQRNTVDKVARQLQRLYQFCRKSWRARLTGRPDADYRLPEKFKLLSAWYTLARKCIELKIDPVKYLYFIFDSLVDGFVPEPHQIFSERLVTAYRNSGSSDRELLLSLKAQQAAASGLYATAKRLGLRGKDAWLWVLEDKNAPLSALYRCACAERLGLDYERFLDDAVRQYVKNPESYDKSWGDLISPSVKEASKALASYLSGEDCDDF